MLESNVLDLLCYFRQRQAKYDFTKKKKRQTKKNKETNKTKGHLAWQDAHEQLKLNRERKQLRLFTVIIALMTDHFANILQLKEYSSYM